MGRARSIRRRSLAIVMGVALASLTLPAAAAPNAEKILDFNEAVGQLPEGIAIDKKGNLFVSIAPLGQLWKFAPGSDIPEIFATVPGINPLTDFGLLGLAVDAPGNVYAGVSSANTAVNGVWKFDRKTGAASRFAGSEAIFIANDVAFDKRGNIYVTDSATGNLWRIGRNGAAEPWLVGDANLRGTGVLGLGVDVGANGIEFYNGDLFVANTEKFSVVRVPVNPDGSPGMSEVVAILPFGELAPGIPFPNAPDGLAMDVHGNVYVAAISTSSVLKVTPSGEVTTAYSGDPLDWASSIAFGTGKGERRTLFAVNFSIGEGNGDPLIRSGPGVVAIQDVAVGLPLP